MPKFGLQHHLLLPEKTTNVFGYRNLPPFALAFNKSAPDAPASFAPITLRLPRCDESARLRGCRKIRAGAGMLSKSKVGAPGVAFTPGFSALFTWACFVSRLRSPRLVTDRTPIALRLRDATRAPAFSVRPPTLPALPANRIPPT